MPACRRAITRRRGSRSGERGRSAFVVIAPVDLTPAGHVHFSVKLVHQRHVLPGRTDVRLGQEAGLRGFLDSVVESSGEYQRVSAHPGHYNGVVSPQSRMFAVERTRSSMLPNSQDAGQSRISSRTDDAKRSPSIRQYVAMISCRKWGQNRYQVLSVVVVAMGIGVLGRISSRWGLDAAAVRRLAASLPGRGRRR